MTLTKPIPATPACFSSEAEWLEYLDAACAAQPSRRQKESPVTLIKSGRISVCGDCTLLHQQQMQASDLCNPNQFGDPAVNDRAQIRAEEASNRGRSNRLRGAAMERELFRLLSHELGIEIKRRLGQARDGGADGEGLPGWEIECKYHKSLSRGTWWRQVCIAARKTLSNPILFYRVKKEAGAPAGSAWRAIVYAHHATPPVVIERIRGIDDAYLISFDDAVRILRGTTPVKNQ